MTVIGVFALQGNVREHLAMLTEVRLSLDPGLDAPAIDAALSAHGLRPHQVFCTQRRHELGSPRFSMLQDGETAGLTNTSRQPVSGVQISQQPKQSQPALASGWQLAVQDSLGTHWFGSNCAASSSCGHAPSMPQQA